MNDPVRAITTLVCGAPVVGGVSCGAIRRLDVVPAVSLVTSLIPGYQPVDLADAYAIPSASASNQTIGIVVAYSDPNADADLATYRSTFGLPASVNAMRNVQISGRFRF